MRRIVRPADKDALMTVRLTFMAQPTVQETDVAVNNSYLLYRFFSHNRISKIYVILPPF